ncbi:plasmid mobilization relaxosome protein MobC [Anaerostipes sp.]|uniref:plasmid mobilization relaxosome protein MobC n=1 Tax=Anaerostipes sp. TaxID=1872530 RepID=UPI0025BF50C8|nr:plasmid mobilization relaxosome protein MobC [Anaerostipes sp.]MBS7008658.1 plasmid mobilization relaxosome protein MobC [Anaerostipes sp.]
MANRTRPLILRVPVNKQERELIEQKLLIDGYIIQIDHSDIKAMTAEIQKIGGGVNVNQIARRMNATGSVYQEYIEKIKGVLAEI